MIMLNLRKLRMNECRHITTSRAERCANARTWSSRASIRSISGAAPYSAVLELGWQTLAVAGQMLASKPSKHCR
jgi:hypothetical protein